MKEYKYNNAIIRVHEGNAYHATIKDATIKFLKKVEAARLKRKEDHENGNINTCRIVEKE